jgi:hypothetical protein
MAFQTSHNDACSSPLPKRPMSPASPRLAKVVTSYLLRLTNASPVTAYYRIRGEARWKKYGILLAIGLVKNLVNNPSLHPMIWNVDVSLIILISATQHTHLLTLFSESVINHFQRNI